jgi:hypothetical protein
MMLYSVYLSILFQSTKHFPCFLTKVITEVLKNSFADSDFIIGLTCVLLTTATFKQLSECLQKPEIDLVTACEMVTDSLSVLKKKRANAEYVYAKAFNEAVGKDSNKHTVLPEQVSYHKFMHSF